MKPLRVLAIPNQRPLPTFHGANADNWRIIRALQRAGVIVGCLTWRDYIADDAYLPELTSLVPDYLEFPLAYERVITSKEAKKLPGFASLRRISGDDRERAVDFVERFAPDLVLLLGLNGGELAMDLAANFGKPLVYRSQAIETQYYLDYFRLLRGRTISGHSQSDAKSNRAQLKALSRFEQLVVSRSALTLEISADYLYARRRANGFNIDHFPPLVSPPLTSSRPGKIPTTSATSATFSCPTTRTGSTGSSTTCYPPFGKGGPQRVVIAGKRPIRDFVRHVRDRAVDVIPNPTEADDIVAGSTVGVNPIFAGNGTTLKTLDYLWNGCAVVTTPIGIQGYRFADPSLPITVAGSAEGFATSIVQRLADRRRLSETRAKLQRFSWEAAGPRLAEMLEGVL